MKTVPAVMVQRKERVTSECFAIMVAAAMIRLSQVFLWIVLIPFKITYMYTYKIK